MYIFQLNNQFRSVVDCHSKTSSKSRCLQRFLLLPAIKCVRMLSPGASLQTPRTGAHQAPLSMEFSRQEYWSG